METPATVNVGWALWGKQPGTSSDYSVLASSAQPLSSAEFGSVLAHFAPGTPPTKENLPSSLPWVIISRVGIEGKPYVGMSIQRSSSEVDGVGRPITMTSYFCVPFAEIAGPPVSYAELYRQLSSVNLPYSGNSLIQLTVPRLEPAAVAAKISQENWEPSVTAAAAMLLDGDVCIVGAEATTMTERLEYLEAVAALLPFGYRADFTAATWSDAGARHQIRLAFAERARPDMAVVQWRSSSARPEADGPGRTYFQLARDVRGHRSGPEQLAILIDTLTRASAPAEFARPQAAIDVLREFDLAFLVLRSVHDGTAQPTDIRSVFALGEITQLDPGDRQVMLGALIGLGDPQDLPAIRQWWDAAVGTDPGVMIDTFVDVGWQLLWSQAASGTVNDFVTLAADQGLLDPVLAGVLAPPSSPENSSVSAAVELAGRWAFANRRPDLPLTRQTIVGYPLLATELLARVAGLDREAQAALAWLEPVMRTFLRPFAIVLGQAPGTVDQLEVGELAQYGDGCVAALLRAASRGNGLPHVLPALAGWLVTRGLSVDTGDRAVAQSWHDQVAALTITDPRWQVWADLALLAAGAGPRFLLATVYGPSASRYCDFFGAAWSELVSDTGQAGDDLLTGRLAGFLEQASWTADPLKVETALRIARMLAQGQHRARLQSAVSTALLRNPEAARLDSAREWLAQVQPDYQDPQSGDVLAVLRSPHASLTAEGLADLCARGYREGLPAEDLCRALAQSRAVVSGQIALKLIDQVRSRINAVRPDQRDPREWLLTMATFMADGSLGEHLQEGFRRAAVQTAHDDFLYRLDILYVAATLGHPDAQPKLSAEDVAHLEWIPRSIDQILRDSKKRSGLTAMLRGGKRDRDLKAEASGDAPG